MNSLRTPLLVANWKMNKTQAEAKAFLSTFNEQLKLVPRLSPDREIVICPPFTALSVVQNVLAMANNGAVRYGSQNMHSQEQGAFTGEVSAPMLQELGCSYVIIGHSERRRDNGETNETVNKKILTALHWQLTPIICVGETLEQRHQEQTEKVVQQQLAVALAGVAAADLSKIVIAYEPIWAIGTGESATPEQAQAVHTFARQFVSKQTRIIYGGSVTTANMAVLMQQPDIDGALVGGASLDPVQFSQIINF